MKNIKTIKVIGAVIALGFAQTTHAALSITGSAFDSVSIGLSTGVNLSTGFVSLGYYSSAPTTSLFSSYTSASSFLNNFTSIASGSTGIDTGSAYYPALFFGQCDPCEWRNRCPQQAVLSTHRKRC